MVKHVGKHVFISADEMKTWMEAIDTINGFLQSDIPIPVNVARKMTDAVRDIGLLYNRILFDHPPGMSSGD